MPAEADENERATSLRAIPVVLRFISCGLLAIALGVAWRFTLAPPRVGIGSAFAGIFFLLLGFILGGLGWYAHDVRGRAQQPQRISDERLVFSFVVFAAMPFVVLIVVGFVWLLAVLIGVR